MDARDCWALVEDCRAESQGDQRLQRRLLRERLVTLPEADIRDFRDHCSASAGPPPGTTGTGGDTAAWHALADAVLDEVAGGRPAPAPADPAPVPGEVCPACSRPLRPMYVGRRRQDDAGELQAAPRDYRRCSGCRAVVWRWSGETSWHYSARDGGTPSG